MSWLFRVLGAIVIWVLVGLLVGFAGTLLVTVDQAQVKAIGNFLQDSSGLIGFVAGAAYFVWGKVPGVKA